MNKALIISELLNIPEPEAEAIIKIVEAAAQWPDDIGYSVEKLAGRVDEIGYHNKSMAAVLGLTEEQFASRNEAASDEIEIEIDWPAPALGKAREADRADIRYVEETAWGVTPGRALSISASGRQMGKTATGGIVKLINGVRFGEGAPESILPIRRVVAAAVDAGRTDSGGGV